MEEVVQADATLGLAGFERADFADTSGELALERKGGAKKGGIAYLLGIEVWLGSSPFQIAEVVSLNEIGKKEPSNEHAGHTCAR